MQYILFETQSNLAELLAFASCGGVLGALLAIVKGEKSTLISIATFACLAICTALSMLLIPKSHIGYQTFLVPLASFFLSHNALK